MKNTFFITTAIDYTNGAPHLGHAYEKVLADVLARYGRLAGKDVFFLTGVDQHGQKVQQSAEKNGVAPQAFVDGITGQFRALWEKLEVRYDGWAATTDERHKQCVRAILQRLWDDKDPATGASRWIYKDSRGGYYSVRQEQFLTDKERGPDGQFGPEWGQVEFREEENYYFRLEGSRQWLLDLIDARSQQGNPLVVPDFRVAELRNAVEKLAGDLCITRPKARLSWGIEVPFDPEFVTFVWFDALVNYISFAPGYDPAVGADLAEFHRWWPALHVIGKDILIPAHGVYWPIMLRALGFSDEQIPTLLVHGWWNVGGFKLSKSLGNGVDPDALVNRYGAEALRYYLMSDIATGRDAEFSEERLVGGHNSDLANSLGNLFNRTLSMIQRYRSGVIRSFEGDMVLAEGITAASTIEGLRIEYIRHLEGWAEEQTSPNGRLKFAPFQVNNALTTVLDLVTNANQLIDQQAPWKLAKDPANAEALDRLLYALAEFLRSVAIVLSPILPKAAHAMFDQLNWKMADSRNETRFVLNEVVWGGLPEGHVVNKPVPLFPRIEAASNGE